jgi:PKD repeat protein
MSPRNLRRGHKALAAVIAAGCILPSSASAFTGTKSLDIETGNFSQFTTTQVEQRSATTKPTATVVSKSSDPANVVQGNYSVRYDMPAHGKRIEHPWDYSNGGVFKEGDDVWIARWQKVDANMWAQAGWNAGHHDAMQLKSLNNDGAAKQFVFSDRDGRWTTGESGSTVTVDPIVRKGVWEKWLMHVKFSSNPSVGKIEFIKDGKLIYTYRAANMHKGYGSYYKQGIYQADIGKASRMWIDGTTISTSRDAAERGAWGMTSTPSPTPAPAQPAATASFTVAPTAPVTGETVQFKGSSNRSDATYSWSLDGATKLTGANPTFKFANPGDKKVTLTVTTPDGKTTSTTKTITVRATQATLNGSFTYSPASPVARGTTVQFNGANNVTGTKYAWSLDGVTTLTGQKPTFKFANAGTKSVKLTVTAPNAKTATTTQTLTVR